MKFNIEYAALCNKGLVREKNQDNFLCASKFLVSENGGLPEMLAGEIDASTFPAFAVFDGMGGEQCGEIAAYIAASHFNELHLGKTKSDTKLFLLETCDEINKKICAYQKENHIRHMGTTAAILMCGQNDVFICNVGDSRIYQYSGKKLAQISEDHSEISTNDRKPPLTQNLGIPESEFVIEPYIAKGKYNSGDRYLICSDGLTDMLSDEEILDILKARSKITEAVQKLMDKALDRGGIDNITVIICEVRKQSRFFSQSRSQER